MIVLETMKDSKEYGSILKIPEVDLLFDTYTKEQQLSDAYRIKNKEIGYKPQLQLEDNYY